MNCRGSTTDCTYRDESGLSNESRKIVVEIIHILNSIPDGQALQTLQLLSTETNAPIILSTLRDVATGTTKLPISPDITMTPKGNSARREFEEQNPVAYPVIPGIDGINLEKKSGINNDGRTLLPIWTAIM